MSREGCHQARKERQNQNKINNADGRITLLGQVENQNIEGVITLIGREKYIPTIRVQIDPDREVYIFGNWLDNFVGETVQVNCRPEGPSLVERARPESCRIRGVLQGIPDSTPYYADRELQSGKRQQEKTD